VADQSATWQQAHKLKCVLAGTTMNRCTIPAMPTLTLNSLGSAAEAANCAKTYCEQHCTASNVNGCNGCILGAPSFCHRYDVTDNTYQKDNSAWWGHPCHTLCVSDGPTSAARKACDKRFRDFRNNPRGWYIHDCRAACAASTCHTSNPLFKFDRTSSTAQISSILQKCRKAFGLVKNSAGQLVGK